MKDKRHALCDRIRSVKSWLNHAEDSFSNANDVRGELNLLLAEAELQHLREKDAKNQAKRRHFLAFAVALGMVMLFAGGWFFSFVGKDAGLPGSGLTVATSDFYHAAALPGVVEQKSVVEDSVQVLKSQEVYYREQSPVQIPVRQEQTSLSNEEIRSLVRTAGQTLRGK